MSFPPEAPPRSGSDKRVIQRILVVDDDPDGAEMMAEMLAGLGFETKFALDGQTAIAMAAEFAPNVLLLDVGLPGMNGYQVARELRRDDTFRGVTLVALTGWSGPERERMALEAGFDHYLVKPINLAALELLLAR